MQKQIDPFSIEVKFECEKCKVKSACSVSEAIRNGAPMCRYCDLEMDICICNIKGE